MHNLALIALVFALLLFSGNAGAEIAAEFDRSKLLIVDSLVTYGTIARPQICPADSNWIAYEIYLGDTVHLIVNNLNTGEKRMISPPDAEEKEISDSAVARISRDLAWRPVALDGRIWAAYVGDKGGSQDLYLYDLSSGDSHRLPRIDTTAASPRYDIWGAPGWSPDGRCLTYSAAIDTDADIYIIKNMKDVLENPSAADRILRQQPLITGPGDQFGAVWCPVPGAGYLAYTEQDQNDARLRIKVFDPLTGRTYDLSGIDASMNYFSPSWNAGGNRIAYYRYGNGGRADTPPGDSGDIKLEVGVATVSIMRDSLTLTPRRVGGTQKENTIEVAPNLDAFLGPAWLPGGRHLVITSYGEPKHARLGVISLPDWEAGETDRDYWLRGLGGIGFDYPRDINTVNRNISFTYQQNLKRYLLLGRIVPSMKLVMTPEYLDVGNNRLAWWSSYSDGGAAKPGLLAKIGNFLWKPIAGPDIGINRGIVPVAGGVALLALLISKDSGGGSAEPLPRDWTPPEFPDGGKINPGLRIRIGF